MFFKNLTGIPWRAPTPLFETYDNFIDQAFRLQSSPLACVGSYLDEFEACLEADRGYAAVRAFLPAFSDNAQTFNSYRSYTERLLLWACASAHWLRHTSAIFDAPLRDPKDLQEDLRHSNLSTTQNTCYHAYDQERAHSVKRIGMRDRGQAWIAQSSIASLPSNMARSHFSRNSQ
ncbi:Hypothetical protein (plasmid) [Pseudomonas putida]|nr:Hypothetical protein [Pseudomonas putida]